MKKNFNNPVVCGAKNLLTQGFSAKAFTMAEILLSLTIIGVVAAITLPSLMGNINERTWNTQRKALHARMSQAIAMMPNLNGFGSYVADTKDGNGSVTSAGTDTAAEAFITEGLSKVLKINNICDSAHLADCGIPTTFANRASGSKSFPQSLLELNDRFSVLNIDTKAAAFETQNGESVALYYNPNCTSSVDGTASYYVQGKVCANFVYDLNGNKGPNTYGKDIGYITVLYSVDPVVVAPVPRPEYAGFEIIENLPGACVAFNPDVRMPNIDELSAIFVNMNIVGGLVTDSMYASGSRLVLNTYGYDMPGAWIQDFSYGKRYADGEIDWHFMCIDR